jgi:DNA polymerase-4
MIQRTILHLDLDAFFCAVEELNTPNLKGKPFAVGGRPDQRGVVASCSYPARVFGIHSAMPMSQAVKLCPHLIIVPQHRQAYRWASRQVMHILQTITPLVEQISIDEAFLDVSERDEPGEMVARRLQKQINDDLHLPCSLGVATNKLVAKIANNQGKSKQARGRPPNAIEVVPPGTEADYLSPLPVQELWGVGPKTAEKLHGLGIYTIGQLASYPQRHLVRLFGKNGYELWLRANGIDTRQVITERPTKSISREITFETDVTEAYQLYQTLDELSVSVGAQVRREQLQGRTIHIKLRWSDFTTITRQTSLSVATNADMVIKRTARALLAQAWENQEAVRLLGVGISGFVQGPRQMSLWELAPDAISAASEKGDSDSGQRRGSKN